MTALKVGIVGAGYIGSVHAGILLRDPRVKIVAVYDIIAEKAEVLAKNVNAKVARGIEELFKLRTLRYQNSDLNERDCLTREMGSKT